MIAKIEQMILERLREKGVPIDTTGRNMPSAYAVVECGAITLIPALIVSALFIFFEVVVYAALIAVMPRSGGDYVWQSRILGGAVGFILAVTGWWFILWLWVPLYGDMFRHIVLVPILGVLGAQDTALWFAGTQNGSFVASLITLGIVSLFIALGMKTYARIQKVSFYGGMIGLFLVIVLLLTGSPEAFREGYDTYAAQIFGAQPGAYDATVALGTAAGAASPLMGGGIALIMLTIPYLVFFNLWPNWGATVGNPCGTEEGSVIASADNLSRGTTHA